MLAEHIHPGAFDAGSDDREHFAVRRTVLQSTSVRQDGFDFCTIASRASRIAKRIVRLSRGPVSIIREFWSLVAAERVDSPYCGANR